MIRLYRNLTGRCLKCFSIMMPRQSMAVSVIRANVGCGVITSLTIVVAGSSLFASNRLITLSSKEQANQKKKKNDRGNVTTGCTLVTWGYSKVPILFQRDMSQADWSTPRNTMLCQKTGRVHPAVAPFLRKCTLFFSKMHPVVSGIESLPLSVGRQTACKSTNNDVMLLLLYAACRREPRISWYVVSWIDKHNNNPVALSEGALRTLQLVDTDSRRVGTECLQQCHSSTVWSHKESGVDPFCVHWHSSSH